MLIRAISQCGRRLTFSKATAVVVIIVTGVMQGYASAGHGCGSWGRIACGGWGYGTCHPSRRHVSRHFYNRNLGSAGFDFWFVPIPGSSPLRQRRESYRIRENINTEKDDNTRKEARKSGGVSTFSVNEDPETGVIDLEMEVPGVLPDSISVELEDNKLLRVSGRRTKLSSKQSEDYEFNQSFRVDEDLNSDDIRVTLSSGILRIQATRRKKTIKKIPIKVAEETSLASFQKRNRPDQIATSKSIIEQLEKDSIKM